MLVVGATFNAGEYPAGLRAGDQLVLLETTRGAIAGAKPTVLGESTVWSALRAQSATGGQLFVSLLVSNADAPRVADAAAGGRLRLLLAGGDGG